MRLLHSIAICKDRLSLVDRQAAGFWIAEEDKDVANGDETSVHAIRACGGESLEL